MHEKEASFLTDENVKARELQLAISQLFLSPVQREHSEYSVQDSDIEEALKVTTYCRQ